MYVKSEYWIKYFESLNINPKYITRDNLRDERITKLDLGIPLPEPKTLVLFTERVQIEYFLRYSSYPIYYEIDDLLLFWIYSDVMNIVNNIKSIQINNTSYLQIMYNDMRGLERIKTNLRLPFISLINTQFVIQLHSGSYKFRYNFSTYRGKFYGNNKELDIIESVSLGDENYRSILCYDKTQYFIEVGSIFILPYRVGNLNYLVRPIMSQNMSGKIHINGLYGASGIPMYSNDLFIHRRVDSESELVTVQIIDKTPIGVYIIKINQNHYLLSQLHSEIQFEKLMNSKDRKITYFVI